MDFINDTPVRKTSKRPSTLSRPGFPTFRDRPAATRRPFWLVFGILYFSICLPAALGAEVSDLIINNTNGHLLLSAKVRNVITEQATAAATDQVSASVIFSVALYQVSRFWFDKKITHQTFTNTIKFNPLKKEYRLMRSWAKGPPLIVGGLNQARHLTTEVKDLKVTTLDGLEKGRNYQIRVQAVCQDKNAVIFSPSACFTTDWCTVDFTF